MFREFCITTVLGLTPGVVLAQCAAPAACTPRCEAPCRRCDVPDTAAPADKAAPGNFLRGPSTGQASGESRSFGIRGPALHIPEVRIALPTLEFPSPVKFKRGAEMLFDQVRGPHSLAEVQNFGNLPDTGAPAAPDAAAPGGDIPASPACSPYYCPPPCDPRFSATIKQLETTLARVESLEAELATLRATAAESAAQKNVVPVHGNGAAKPAMSAAAKGSHPVSSKPTHFVQASFEELAPTPAPLTRTPSRTPATARAGLSTPKLQSEPNEFGAWSRSSRK